LTTRLRCCVLPLLLVGLQQDQAGPLVDHHQHLLGERAAMLVPGVESFTASDLVRLLDEADIRQALVLSLAYQFGNPNRPAVEDEYAQVRAENDWTSREVARFRDRLRGFCGFNPLEDYALEELARCSQDSHLSSGIKLHFGNSDVDLDNPVHVEQLRRVLRAANENRMAIVVHMRSSVTRQRPYGAAQARTFLNELLPAIPDSPVQIAHLAGAGGYADPAVDEALAVFVDAIANGDARMTHVYFDLSGVARSAQTEDQAALIAMRIRQLGVGRVLYGSDGAVPGNTPREAWTRFRQLPLSESEFRAIENNIAPYMR
jgi:uncharacterized protein